MTKSKVGLAVVSSLVVSLVWAIVLSSTILKLENDLKIEKEYGAKLSMLIGTYQRENDNLEGALDNLDSHMAACGSLLYMMATPELLKSWDTRACEAAMDHIELYEEKHNIVNSEFKQMECDPQSVRY